MKHRETHPEPIDGCYACRLASVQFSPAAMPTRNQGNRLAHPPAEPRNSWERGIPTDSRNMPFLRPGGDVPWGQKGYAENRHAIEEGRRRAKA